MRKCISKRYGSSNLAEVGKTVKKNRSSLPAKATIRIKNTFGSRIDLASIPQVCPFFEMTRSRRFITQKRIQTV